MGFVLVGAGAVNLAEGLTGVGAGAVYLEVVVEAVGVTGLGRDLSITNRHRVYE